MSLCCSFQPIMVQGGQQWSQCCHGGLLKSPIMERQNSLYCPNAASEYPAIIRLYALILNELPLAAKANQPELIFHLFVKPLLLNQGGWNNFI